MTLARCFGCRPVLLRLLWVIEELVPHQLWERVAPLLRPPKPRRYRYPGRRPIEDRAALAGTLFAASAVVGDSSDRRVNRLVTSLVKSWIHYVSLCVPAVTRAPFGRGRPRLHCAGRHRVVRLNPGGGAPMHVLPQMRDLDEPR